MDRSSQIPVAIATADLLVAIATADLLVAIATTLACNADGNQRLRQSRVSRICTLTASPRHARSQTGESKRQKFKADS